MITIVIFRTRLKKLSSDNSFCSNVIDDCYTDADIADFFAHKYQDLYTSTPFNGIDMHKIRSDLSAAIQNVSSECILMTF